MYEDKQEKYYSHIRDDLIELVPNSAENKVLEVGCGSGETGYKLKQLRKAKEVIGIELSQDAGEKAKSKLDKVIIGDVEKLELPFSKGYFNCLILGDTLEHLFDPWATLRKLVKSLTEGGYVIASIPNVRYWRVIRDLLIRGKWDYCEEGILDKTHLRFFTRSSITDLFVRAGLEIEKITYEKIWGKSRAFDVLTFGLFRDLLIRRFLIRGLKQLVNSM